MKRLAILVFAILIFGASVPFAHSFYITEQPRCSNLDLRQAFQLKMRNQGDVSWCYAHSAADYLQFVHRVPVQISAADIATNYNQRRWPRFMKWLIGGVVAETGFIRGAINDIQSTGYCPEEYFPSETWTKRILKGKDEGQAVQVPIKKALEEFIGLVELVNDGIFLSAVDLPYVFEFKGVTQQQFTDVLFHDDYGDALNELRSLACDSHRMPFPKNLSGVAMEWKGRNTFGHINDVLDRHMPVTVDFFYGFLENIDNYSYSIADLHTTLLMGRRYDSANGECQYLIKNSYGTDCSSYDHRHSCEGGYIWVSESSLFGAMTSFVKITGLEPGFSGTAQQTQDEPDFR